MILRAGHLRPIQSTAQPAWSGRRPAGQPRWLHTRVWPILSAPAVGAELQAQWELAATTTATGSPLCWISTSTSGYGTRSAGMAVRDWPKPLGFVWGLDDPVATNQRAQWIDGNCAPSAAAMEPLRVGLLPAGRGSQSICRALSLLVDSAGYGWATGRSMREVCIRLR